ncbi:translin-associated factor X-interacting protein 1 isoform X1 [Podarcis raffonei]|uniref:translin-associated factor X-interacting protein 1 isoform X1 n=1 Tax=Podarcis raffonei TaxID=65483 RepID=UPI002329405F|nr:translin-associated factor X-interacting protein 1 isoform X1 [Podarcis raffonei]
MKSSASTFLPVSSQDSDKRVSFLKCTQNLNCQEKLPDLKESFQKKRKSLSHSSSQLSSWPAYAPGHIILQNRKPCTTSEWQSINKEQLPLSIPKPRYLEDLESHLRRELQALDLTKGKVQELKLQPYREVFEFFMEEFRTYKPLLASIKKEYELTIAYLKEKIYSLESVNAILVTASDQCTRQILAFQEQEKIQIAKLKDERIYLLKLIDKMKEEKYSLETQVAKMRKAVAEEYLRYLNESDARKLLLIDLNEMYRLKEEMKFAQIQDEKGEDSVKLTLALKVARHDLTKAQVELNTMKANYGDVVPRREFELQEHKCNELTEKMTILQKDFDDLQEEYDTMLDIHKQVSEERDKFYNDLINVQRSSTPRPSWEKCADVIADGAERWSALSEGKTSDQLVDVLLEEIGAGLLRERDTFVALGRSEKVPVYLRCDGVVRNKKLTKKEIVTILKEIWKEKIASDLQKLHLSLLQKGKQSSLPEFFLNFFQKRYGDAPGFDWTYSVYENIKLYKSNEAMSLFHQILTGELDEAVYHSHLQDLANLVREVTAADTANTGQLTRDEFIPALRAAFPLKTEESIQELIVAAGYKPEYPETSLSYKLLFIEDEEGKTEPFVRKLKKQYVNEKRDYIREIQAQLGTLMEVRPDDLRAAFCILDHGLSERTLESYICYAFQVSKDQLDPAVSIPIEVLMKRLKAGDIRRQGTVIGDAKYQLQSHALEETEALVSI